MKRLLPLLFILAIAVEGHAQVQRNPDSSYGQVVVITTANTASTSVNVIGLGIISYQFTCNPLATVTTAGVTLQTSTDNSTWSTLIASTDCSVPAQSAITSGTANYVRINATTFDATGSVRVAWRGFSAASSSSTDVVTELESVVSELETANVTLEAIDTNTASTDNIGVLPRATDTGGWNGTPIITTASTNGTTVTTAATGNYGYRAINTTTTIAYLKIYNAVAPTSACGATALVDTIPIPPASAAGGAGGLTEFYEVPNTADHTTGLSACVTGGGSSTDNTVAPAGIYIQFRTYVTP